MQGNPVLLLTRQNQVGVALPILKIFRQLNRNVMIGLLEGPRRGSKKHLSFSESSTFSDLELLQSLGRVFFFAPGKDLPRLPTSPVYFSFNSPETFMRGVTFPAGSWVQVQNGGGDLLISLMRSRRRPDQLLLWGEGWVSGDIAEDPEVLPGLRDAASWAASHCWKTLGDVRVPEAMSDRQFSARPRHVHYFEPNILSRKASKLFDCIEVSRLKMKKRDEIGEIQNSVANLAFALSDRNYSLGYRSRQKTLSAPLGQSDFAAGLDDSHQASSESIMRSQAIVSFLPSTSALEAVRYGAKSFQLSTLPLLEPFTENAITPNYAMYRSLRAHIPNHIIDIEGISAEEALERMEQTPTGDAESHVERWSAMRVDRLGVIDESLWHGSL